MAKNYVVFMKFFAECYYMTDYGYFDTANQTYAKRFTYKQASKMVNELNREAKIGGYRSHVYGWAIVEG